ncbi:MAG: outer membrane beta-barrel protein [Flavobacteriaceae bacterium]
MATASTYLSVAFALALAAQPAFGQQLRGTLDEKPFLAGGSSDEGEAETTGSVTRKPKAEPVAPRPASGSIAARNAEADQRYLEDNPLTASLPEPERPPDPADDLAPETAPAVPPEDDPFAAPGIRVGAFTLKPSFEASAGYTDNAGASATDKRSSAVWRSVPALDFESGWSRHSLSGSAKWTREDYSIPEQRDRETIDASIRGRLDVSSLTVAEGSLAYNKGQESISDPDVPATAAAEPDIETLSGEASIERRFGRFLAGLFGEYERTWHESVADSGGGTIDNSDRDYHSVTGGLRLGYEVSDRTTVFAEAFRGKTTYDRPVDDDGYQRGSTSHGVAAGVRLNRALVTGEARIGYRITDPDDPSFAEIRGLIADVSLSWQATPLTSISLEASAGLGETVVAGASGVRETSVTVSAEHALRRNLIATGSLGWQRADYVGTGQREDVVTAEAGLEYRMNRYAALRGAYRFERSDPGSGSGYDVNTVTFGIILRR